MSDNDELRLAWDFVENTGVSIFLTGKAGTGKTTFLRAVQQRSPKRMVVVAPTGVAAINAGGMTIHSFFQLPLSPFVPESMFKQRFDFSKEKKRIIRTIDLLVIDEISMVRSDLLDAIDSVMRRFRDPRRPFGGVQLLLIGDLQQLTPVVTAEDEAILSRYYDTPYFFGSKALQQTPYVTLELKHVYRQQDEEFLSILNHIRVGRPSAEDIAKLNSRLLSNTQSARAAQSGQNPFDDGGSFIRLTTHNRIADSYNENELLKLREQPYHFQAQIEGTFPEYAYPTDVTLTLKRGAQVMFVKNDPSAEHRFFNGRIGRITSISDKAISVRCDDDEEDIQVEPLVWENAKYELNPDTKEIETKIQGTFRQYPLRLAWAITIHKSQGLTFERAVIDASQSFAAGQVYVALSRCKSLKGLRLASPVNPSTIFGDRRVEAYIAREEEEATKSIAALPSLKEQFHREQLRELFDFSELERKYGFLLRQLEEHFYSTYPRLCAAHRVARNELTQKIVLVSRKWMEVISKMPAASLLEAAFLQRINRSAVYFLNMLTDLLGDLLQKTNVDTDNKTVQRRLNDALADCLLAYQIKTAILAAIAKDGFTPSSYLHLKQQALLNAIDKTDDTTTAKTNKRRKSQHSSKPSAKFSQATSASGNSKAARPAVSDDIQDKLLYEQLRNWRWEKSKELDLAPYTILQQKALVNIVNTKPLTLEELVAIPHFGKVSAEKYGRDILDIVRKHS